MTRSLSTLTCKITFALSLFFVCSSGLGSDDKLSNPTVDQSTVFIEKDGLVAVEAEHFFKQTLTDKRAFYLTTNENAPQFEMDGDPTHVGAASNGAYLEILPDTRRNHGEKLIGGENFSNEPGKLAVVHYKINFTNPGRYYVWVRAHSTGSEDNGIHVGVDGTWPESGQRMQWCIGKNTWRWDSMQRTEKEHCGVPHQIFIEIDKPGEHEVHFSLREDGFEFDKFLLTKELNFDRPDGVGPKFDAGDAKVPTYPFVKAPNNPKAPMPKPVSAEKTPATPKAANDNLLIKATKFPITGTNYYVDQDKWLAINPDTHKSSTAKISFPYPTGNYNVTLRAVGENDGQSNYEVGIGDLKLEPFTCPLSKETYETGKEFSGQWKNVRIEENQPVSITSTIGSADGNEFSRARWAAIVFRPANDETKLAVAPMLNSATENESNPSSEIAAKNDHSTSPTKPVSDLALILPRQPDGDGSLKLTGETKQWHKLTFTINGPYAHEQDNDPNPFIDYAMELDVRHDDGTTYRVPGYFAADGNAGETSAESGTMWRAHFAPDRLGRWTFTAVIYRGSNVALDRNAPRVEMARGQGSFNVAASDKTGVDFRGKGRLQFVNKRYLQHMGTGQYFIKAGADAPETLLGYADFDNTVALKTKKVPLKTYSPHVQDWHDGDPNWKDGKGKGLIGAVNYLSGKGCNAFSFLTYNAGGDGDNVWPFIQREDKLHYDCSKLDQWGIVFDHGTAKGMYLHFKMQETENDDHRKGHGKGDTFVPTCLDGGNLGTQRKLYVRELVARFGHNLALNWNLGEENTQSTKQQMEMIEYIRQTDPYHHNVVVHTYPEQQDKIYNQLIGDRSGLTGTSLQNSDIADTHAQTVKWVAASTATGKPWIVAFDESGTAAHGQCPDLGYKGFDGTDKTGKKTYTQHEVRRQTLWGNLMGGGAGVEYYFGYQFDENDLVCEDWRSRDQSWDYCRIALEFFQNNEIPFSEMDPADELVGNQEHNNSKYCLAATNSIYLVYLPEGGSTDLDLSQCDGQFSVWWFNPRTGGPLFQGPQQTVHGGAIVKLDSGKTDGEDWLAIIRKN